MASIELKGFKPGDQFLKYEIRHMLGRGGQAFVFHGFDTFLERDVAIKVIPLVVEQGKELRQRAQMEAKVLSRLQHPRIVSVFDAGVTEEGAVYIVMEILRGRTLRDALQDAKRLSITEGLTIGAQIAQGVAAAHALNAIHRDLKPENVFVQPGNAVKVLDFGIAKVLGHGNTTTQSDVLHGTMLYMSPEYLQGFGVTVRSDIYALGTILYEALAGISPALIGMQEQSVSAVAISQISRLPPPLEAFTSGAVPSYVARVIQRMIAKDPADRFASMTEVDEQLRAALARYQIESGSSAVRELSERLPPELEPFDKRRTVRGEPVFTNQLTVRGLSGEPNDTSPLSRPPLSALGSEAAPARPVQPASVALPPAFSPPLPHHATLASAAPIVQAPAPAVERSPGTSAGLSSQIVASEIPGMPRSSPGLLLAKVIGIAAVLGTLVGAGVGVTRWRAASSAAAALSASAAELPTLASVQGPASALPAVPEPAAPPAVSVDVTPVPEPPAAASAVPAAASAVHANAAQPSAGRRSASAAPHAAAPAAAPAPAPAAAAPPAAAPSAPAKRKAKYGADDISSAPAAKPKYGADDL